MKIANLFNVLVPADARHTALVRMAIIAAIEAHLDREKFLDRRRRLPLEEWQYLWDALAWADGHVVRMKPDQWLELSGECWLLADKDRSRAWRIRPGQGSILRDVDVYLIPIGSPDRLYISGHEEALGPWCIPLHPTWVETLRALAPTPHGSR